MTIERVLLGALLGASVAASGCAGGTGDSGLGGSGGTGAADEGGAPPEEGGAPSEGGGGSAPVITDLQSACEAGCDTVAELTVQLSCTDTPNCVADCVSYGDSLTTCRPQYEALMKCAVFEMSTDTCYCSQSSGHVACDLCPSELSAFQNCIAFKNDHTN